MLSVVPASCGAALPATSIRPLRGVLRAAAVLLSLMLLAAAPAAGQAYVYWGSTSGKIGRANLDGTGVSAGFMTGLGAVSGDTEGQGGRKAHGLGSGQAAQGSDQQQQLLHKLIITAPLAGKRYEEVTNPTMLAR